MRIAVFLLALVASASLLAAAHAQEPPDQLSPPAGLPATGSISGRILVEGSQRPYQGFRGYVSAEIPQPIPLDQVRFFEIDDRGNFSISSLAADDYFILLLDWEFVEPPGEDVLFPVPEGIGPPGGVFVLPGLRVAVANGQAVAGLEIVVRPPEPIPGPSRDGCEPLSPPSQLSPPSDISPVCAPTTGTGPGRAGDTAAYFGLGVAGLAALLLAGGVALRARRVL